MKIQHKLSNEIAEGNFDGTYFSGKTISNPSNFGMVRIGEEHRLKSYDIDTEINPNPDSGWRVLSLSSDQERAAFKILPSIVQLHNSAVMHLKEAAAKIRQINGLDSDDDFHPAQDPKQELIEAIKEVIESTGLQSTDIFENVAN